MNRIRAALGAAAFAFSSFANIGQQISLVPTYLAHLLWLIEQKYRDLTEQGYKGNAAVYACLRLLCASVPEPPLIPHVMLADGEAGDALAWSHPLRQLIRRPNPLTSEYEFWELVTLHVSIVGRSTWWKERDNAGRLIALWPLRPDRVGPIYGRPEDAEQSGDSADSVLVGWSYLVPGTTHYVPIPRHDVLLFNLPDPMGESGGMVEGLGPLMALASEISADNEATKYVGSLLANDARPSTVLKIKGKITSPDDAKLIKAAYTAEYGGRGRGRVGLVDNDTDVVTMGFNLRELEFPSLRRISESRVCAAFGVPAILVGLLVGLEAGIRATISEQREFFTETTLANLWRRFSDTFTNDIAAEYGANIICLFDVSKVKALAAQSVMELDRTRDAFQVGAVTVNEYRDALNLAPVDGGDIFIRGIAPGQGIGTPETTVNAPNAPAAPAVATASMNGKVDTPKEALAKVA